MRRQRCTQTSTQSGAREGVAGRASRRASRRRHTVVQASQAGVDDLALGLVAVWQSRVCVVQIRVGRGIVEL